LNKKQGKVIIVRVPWRRSYLCALFDSKSWERLLVKTAIEDEDLFIYLLETGPVPARVYC